MADNNSTNNKNVTGSYPGVTGSYKKQSRVTGTASFNKTIQNNSDTIRIDPVSSRQKNSDTIQIDPVKKVTGTYETLKTSSVEKTAPQPKQDFGTIRIDPVAPSSSFYPEELMAKPDQEEQLPEEQNKKTRSQKIKEQQNQDGFKWKMLFSKENNKGFWVQIRFYGLILLVSIFLSICVINISNDVFAFIKKDEVAVVTIPKGMSTLDVGKTLEKAGVIEHPNIFRLYCKLKKAEGKFQYGDYSLNSNFSYDQIISKLKKTSVQAETVKVVIPEGATQDDIVEILTAGKYTNITELDNALNTYEFEEYEFLKNIPERRCRLEGYLPAGEYELYVGESAVSIVSKMLDRFQKNVLTEQNKKLIKKSGKSIDDIITTASLIQAECTNSADYKKVASVIANRLSSPTANRLNLTSPINYVLPEAKKTLSPDDKKTDSKYNTYIYSGLPEGPVCNPTLAAIEAVLNPESTAYNYFISDGEKTTFSSTEAEHKSALEKASNTAKGTDVIK